MGLISQQDILHAAGYSYEQAIESLRLILEDYPDVRIVSITSETITVGGLDRVQIMAVVESV